MSCPCCEPRKLTKAQIAALATPAVTVRVRKQGARRWTRLEAYSVQSTEQACIVEATGTLPDLSGAVEMEIKAADMPALTLTGKAKISAVYEPGIAARHEITMIPPAPTRGKLDTWSR